LNFAHEICFYVYFNPMKIKASLYLSALAVVFGVMNSCVNHDLEGPFVVDCTNASAYTYDVDILPIINANCAFEGCHDGGTVYPPDWTDFQTFKDHSAEVQRRITLPLTDPDKMPRGRRLSAEDRQKIYCWIEQGAPQN
jgi:hypothetical protein